MRYTVVVADTGVAFEFETVSPAPVCAGDILHVQGQATYRVTGREWRCEKRLGDSVGSRRHPLLYVERIHE